jgi:signal transduction histidine kinase
MTQEPATTASSDNEKTWGELLSELRELKAQNAILKESPAKNAAMPGSAGHADERLQRANRAFKVLSGCQGAMIRAEDEATLLNDICRILVEVGGYRLAWIGYIEKDDLKTVRPVARAGHDEGYVDNLKIALGDPVLGSGPTGISLKAGKPYGASNVVTDDAMQPWRREALKRGYLSTLNLPIIYEKQVIGALAIYSDRLNAFNEEEQRLLFEMAETLAYGITSIRERERRIRAEKQLQRANEGLETRIRERTEELRSAKEETELYIDLMGHDINNFNQITMGFLELARDMARAEGKLGADGIDLLEKAIESLANSSRLIANVRKLQREKMGLYKPQVLDLGGTLEGVCAQFKHVPDRHVKVNCVATRGIKVQANELLRDVFINLIGNAIKHSSGPLFVNIRMNCVGEKGRKRCEVLVEDNGPGIPDDLKRTLFERLSLSATRSRGKGFGLCLIKMLVDDFQGMFRVEDRVEGDHTKGARFVVTLPVVDK